MARSINSPHGVQILQTNDATAFLWEQNTWFHWVPTDPNFKWPADLTPAWNGVSVGHWDGDTLVVETSGFNGYTRLDTNGHPHSAEAKFINTFTRTDSRTIQHTFTVHDPDGVAIEFVDKVTLGPGAAPQVPVTVAHNTARRGDSTRGVSIRELIDGAPFVTPEPRM